MPRSGRTLALATLAASAVLTGTILGLALMTAAGGPAPADDDPPVTDTATVGPVERTPLDDGSPLAVQDGGDPGAETDLGL